MEKRQRLFQFLFALVLSFGMLFFSARTVFAEEDGPAPEEGSGNQTEETIVQAQDTPAIVDYAPVNVVSEGGEVYSPEAIVTSVEAYYTDAPAEGSSEGSGDGESNPVTAGEVYTAITDAQLAEGAAGAAALPAGGDTTTEIVTDEAIAVIAGESAKDSIHDANNIPDPEAADAAEQAVSGFEDANNALADNVSVFDMIGSGVSEIAAEAALIDAQNAESKSEAQEAADAAQKAYEQAQKYADDANEALIAASEKKAEAEAAYQAAKEAYDLVMQEAQAELADGEMALEYAVLQAEEAMKAAYEYYLQAEAEEAAAIAARDLAKENFDNSKQALEDAIKNLPAVIGGAAGETAGYLVESVESGIGQGLSEAAVKYYEELVAYKLWLIAQYQENIADAEKLMAVELQERLDSAELDEAEKTAVKQLLSVLLITDDLRNDGIAAETFNWGITEIDGFNIADSLPAEHRDGVYVSVKDSEGNYHYYEVQDNNDALSFFPIIFEKNDLEADTLPSINDVLDENCTTQKVLGKTLYYGTAVSYVAEKENEELETERYNISAIKYDGYLIKLNHFLVTKSDLSIQNIINNIYNLGSLGAISKSTLEPLMEQGFQFYSHFIVVDEDSAFTAEERIAQLKEDGFIPDPELRDTDLSILVSDFTAYCGNLNTKIDEIEEELYGGSLDRLIQKYAEGVTEDNLDLIIDKIRNLGHSDDEDDEEKPGFLDTLAECFSIEDYDWSEGTVADYFSSGLANLRQHATASMIDAASGLVEDLFGSIDEWNFSRIDFFDLLELLFDENVANIIDVIDAFEKGEFTEDTWNAIIELLDFRLADNSKLALAKAFNMIMDRWHHEAVTDLSNSITTGKENILEALQNIRTAAEDTVRNGVELGKAELALIPAKTKKGYALVLYGTTANAYVQAYEAKELFSAYKDGFQPKNLIELTEKLEAAEAEFAKLSARADTLNENAAKAKAAAEAAQKIADEFIEYNIWIQGTKVTSKNQNDVLKDGKISVTVESLDSDPSILNATVLLNNAEISVKDLEDEIQQDLSAGIYASGFNEFIIKIQGDANKIKATSLGGAYSDTVAGIYVTDTIETKIINASADEEESQAEPAVLTIDTRTALAPFAAKNIYGIFTDCDLVMKQVTLDVTSGSALDDLKDSVSYGIYSASELYITDGSDVKASGNNAVTSAGIAADVMVNINDSKVTAEGAAAVKSYGITADQIYIYNSDVNASSGITGTVTAGLYSPGSGKDSESGSGLIDISNDSFVKAVGGYALDSSYGILADRLDISGSTVEAYSNSALEESVAVKVHGSDEDFPAITLISGTSDDNTVIPASLSGVSKAGSILWHAVSDLSIGISAPTISVGDHCGVYGTAGKASDGSFGIISDKITMSGASNVSGLGGKAENSIGIFSSVICDDTADGVMIEGIGGEGDNLSYGIWGDLTVKGTGDYISQVLARGGNASDSSVGLLGNLNADGNFNIIIAAGDASTKKEDSFSYGIYGNVAANGKEDAEGEETMSQISVTSGEAAYSIGIYGQATGDEVNDSYAALNHVSLNVTADAASCYSAGIFAGYVVAANNAEITAGVGSEESSALKPEWAYGILANTVLAGKNSKISGAINIPAGMYSVGINAEDHISALEESWISGIAYIAGEYSMGIQTPVLDVSASIITAMADSSKTSIAISADDVNLYNGSYLIAAAASTYDKPKQSIGLNGNLNIIHKPDSRKNTAIITSAEAEDQSIGLNGKLSASGAYEVTIHSGSAAESFGILGDLSTEGADKESSIIKIKAADATDKSIGIKGTVNLDKATLKIETGDVSDITPEDLTLSSDGILRAGLRDDFIAPVSAGINGAVTANDSIINISYGSGALNYGIAGFDEAGGKNITFLNSNVTIGDPEREAVASLGSVGISAGTSGELSVSNSDLYITAANVKEGFSGSGSTALSPIKIFIGQDSTVYAIAGDADYSSGVDTPGDLIISDSSLYAEAGTGRKSACGILAAEVSLTNTSFLRSAATQGDNGIGLYGKLNAGDISQIALLGTYKALEYLEGSDPEFAGRDVFISYDVDITAPFDLWKEEYPLNSEKYKKMVIGLVDKSEYTVVSGADATWTLGSTSPLAARIQNADKSKDGETFRRFVTALVDGVELVRDVDYTAYEGSVIINLLPSFLNKLEEGKHQLNAVFSDGDDAITHFYIRKQSSGSGSSDSGKSSSKTSSGSTVVTCQMAGYPEGYVWNEAARACQPGFGGTVSAVRRYSSPKTADSRGYLIAFISSILAAITCAYVLKQDEA